MKHQLCTPGSTRSRPSQSSSMSSATAQSLVNTSAAQSTPPDLVHCPLDAVVNIPPPRRGWVQLTGSDENVRLAELLRHDKPVKWNLPAPIASCLKSISDSSWWIINRLAKAPEDILWPKWWVRAAGPAPDPSRAFRAALRLVVSLNTDAYKRKHWICERCRNCESSQVWHIDPTFGAFASVVEDWLGPEQVQILAFIGQRSWPEEIRKAILEAHREKCRLTALCKGCVSGHTKGTEERSVGNHALPS